MINTNLIIIIMIIIIIMTIIITVLIIIIIIMIIIMIIIIIVVIIKAARKIHKPEKVLESENCKILWDFTIQTEKTLEHNQPDITVTDKKSKKCI